MKTNRRNRSPHRGGFTLLEVMVVLFILVTIAGLAVVVMTGQREAANRRAAFTYVKLLANAVDQYDMQAGHPPTSEQGIAALISKPPDLSDGKWAGPYIKDNAKSTDPWGIEYRYASPGRDGRSFDIWSCGPDRIDGTDDDIGSWMGSIDD